MGWVGQWVATEIEEEFEEMGAKFVKMFRGRITLLGDLHATGRVLPRLVD
jgi:hypothetical protein